MSNINFPLTLQELTEMRKDNDKVSLFFAYACIGCFLLFILFLAISYLSLCQIFKPLSIVTLSLAAVFLFVVYYYRPLFLARKDKNIKHEIVQWINARREYYKNKEKKPIWLEPEQLAKRFGFKFERTIQALSELLGEGEIFMDGKGEFWFWNKEGCNNDKT